MIDHLDRMMRQMLLDEIDPTLMIGFQPPDEDWRTKAVPPDRNALNVYLVELRENRRLRTNERTDILVDGDIEEEPAPRRVDCHYLISAWSPARAVLAIEPTLDEHALLHQVASAFANREPLVANEIFATVPFPPNFPPVLIVNALPVSLLSPEGYAKLPEFWGTMGEKQALKPVVHVAVTLPLEPERRRSGPIVTTRALTFRFLGDPFGAPDQQFEIGGYVLDAVTPPAGEKPKPTPDVWVELLDSDDVRIQLARTSERGRFVFSGLEAAQYKLRASAAGFPVLTRVVIVPSPSGEYDLTFA